VVFRFGLDGCGKYRPPPGFDPRTIQPGIESRWGREICSFSRMKPYQFLPFSFIPTFLILFLFLSSSFVELQECTDGKIRNCTSSSQDPCPYRVANCCRIFGGALCLNCNCIPVDTASPTGGFGYSRGCLITVKHHFEFDVHRSMHRNIFLQ
jgi:hypothetical protein